MLRTALSLLATLALALAGCGRAEPKAPPSPSAPLKVVCTTSHCADLVRALAGPRAAEGGRLAVSALMGEGVDPHTYKLTRQDSAALGGADIVIASGLHLEGKMDDALHGVERPGHTLIKLGNAAPEDKLLKPENAAGQLDPHFWMDCELFAGAAEHLVAKLTERDPEGRAQYAQGLKEFRAQVNDLDAYARGAFSSIPAARRILITSHDAFGYLGRRYGIRVLAVQGISTESEAGVRDVENLVSVIVDNRVPAVFIETSVSRRTIDAIVAGCAAKNHTVVIGGTLFSDALGPPGTYEGTYMGMMDHNITTIARALGAPGIPPRGRAGKLSAEASR